MMLMQQDKDFGDLHPVFGRKHRYSDDKKRAKAYCNRPDRTLTAEFYFLRTILPISAVGSINSNCLSEGKLGSEKDSLSLNDTQNGEGGIRTPGTGICPYDGLANRYLKPLGHLSEQSLVIYISLARIARR